MALAVRFGILTTAGWARRSVRRETLPGIFVLGIAAAPILLFVLRLLPATTAVCTRIAPQEV